MHQCSEEMFITSLVDMIIMISLVLIECLDVCSGVLFLLNLCRNRVCIRLINYNPNGTYRFEKINIWFYPNDNDRGHRLGYTYVYDGKNIYSSNIKITLRRPTCRNRPLPTTHSSRSFFSPFYRCLWYRFLNYPCDYDDKAVLSVHVCHVHSFSRTRIVT